MSSKAVTRKGDADVVHCSVPHRLQHSPDVYVNNCQDKEISTLYMYYQVYLALLTKHQLQLDPPLFL